MYRNAQIFLFFLFVSSVFGQSVVQVGKGGYASYPPLIKCRSVDHGGDQSMYMQTRDLFIRERESQPIPTNDWWTDMIKETQPFSGHLWSYPQYVEAFAGGVTIANADYWISNGTEMKPSTLLKVSGVDFAPQNAVVETWHDWDMEFSLAEGGKSMLVTMAHGVPFTWIEAQGMSLRIDLGGAVSATADGNAWLVTKQGRDDANNTLVAYYGVYLPVDASSRRVGDDIVVDFAGNTGFASVAVLPSAAALEDFRPYAPNVVRSTRVDWSYNAATGVVSMVWNVSAEHLGGESQSAPVVLQGFLPHHYRDGAAAAFEFTPYRYVTPHGRLKLARGNTFTVNYAFSGMLPYYAVPTDTLSAEHPFSKSRMRDMIAAYASQGGFGTDTYWGGKGLTQMALYMMFAREMGETALFNQCRDRLKAALVNWLTYTPGEDNMFFARYDRWGALIGYNTSYDSETFNDHHFHYGYFTYAGALLCLVDDDFRVNYGAMLREVAKDYANWERDDTRYPLFRTFDPWSGHSFAGGMGDGNGNGQESSSEAMQSWGGLYLLGVALGDDAMRDAGLFGYVSEARAVAEYWFDRHRLLNDGTQNIDYTKFLHPYNSNLTCHGVGWWNYFSGDQLWNAAIQWMPISPCLDYLSEDLDYTRWDYETAWSLKSTGGWYDRASHVENGNTIDDGSLGDASGLGNVVLSYLQRFDPRQAAEVFDNLYDSGASTARATDTGGITYFITHSHMSHGEIAWDVHGDIPASRAFRKADQTMVYAAYNATAAAVDVHFSDGYVLHCAPRRLTVSDTESRAVTDITPVDTGEPDVREQLVMPNLALHKPVTVSGYENVSTVPLNLTDGNAETRWGSLHYDNQWCSVNLQKPARIYKLRILWETAYASEYKVLVSSDGANYTLVKDMTSSGGTEIIAMDDIEAQYVKIIGIRRSTQYGISIYELEVYGSWLDAGPDDLVGMKITAGSDVLTQGQPSALSCEGYTVSGQWTSLSGITWSSADGTVTVSGVFTPSKYPAAEVEASYGGFTAKKSFVVEEAMYCTSAEICMAATRVVVNQPEEFAVKTYNQFGAPYDADANVNVYLYDEGRMQPTTAATVDNGCFSASSTGVYAIEVTVEQAGREPVIRQQLVEVVNFADINLALHKPATATSENGGNTAAMLTDGSLATRWESLWGDQYTAEWKNNQQVTVDLRGVYSINSVIITWEGAYAESFTLQVSTDGEVWTDVGTYSVTSNALVQNLGFADVEARYVRLLMLRRHLTAYGYSIYEIEVYGTSMISTTLEETKTVVNSPRNLYAPDGRLIMRDTTADRIRQLPAGVYILGNEKIIVGQQ